jgi:hypothetical protein
LRIITVTNHPGGARAVLPVLSFLGSKEFSCRNFTSECGRSFYEKENIEAEIIQSRISLEYIHRIFEEWKPDALIAGTSEPEDKDIGRIEPLFVVAAAKHHIPSLSVLDHWCGYKDRYSLNSSMKMDALSTVICVMDNKAKAEMISEGISQEIIKVTGNPAWDRLQCVHAQFSHDDRNRVRTSLNMKSDERIFLFVSEPIEDDGQHTEYGFSEYQVVEDLLGILSNNSNQSNTHLYLSFHPRDNRKKYDKVLRQFQNIPVHLINPAQDIFLYGFSADCVVGITSMLLVEFSILGFRNFISYQPVGSKEPALTLGYNVPLVKNKAALETASKFIESKKIQDHSTFYNSTMNVIKEFSDMVSGNIQ